MDGLLLLEEKSKSTVLCVALGHWRLAVSPLCRDVSIACTDKYVLTLRDLDLYGSEDTH